MRVKIMKRRRSDTRNMPKEARKHKPIMMPETPTIKPENTKKRLKCTSMCIQKRVTYRQKRFTILEIPMQKCSATKRRQRPTKMHSSSKRTSRQKRI